MRDLNTYIEEGFFQNVGADVIDQINSIPRNKTHNLFTDPNYNKLLELAHLLPKGTILTYKNKYGINTLEKVELRDASNRDFWTLEFYSERFSKGTHSAPLAFKDYFTNSNVISGSIELKK